MITLPYLNALAESLPGATLDLLTREEAVSVPRATRIFGRVFALGGGRSERWQLVQSPPLLLRLMARGYDAVLDLQNNRVSRLFRRVLRPPAWSAFDRVSPISAGERTRRTIAAAGFALPVVRPGFALADPEAGWSLLREAGWHPGEPLVVLNPAGAFSSRHWPMESYVAFARLWQARHGGRFLALGLASIAPRVHALEEGLGAQLINLVGRTDSGQALSLVRQARLVLSEDSGLMHMAWVSGVPTLALFGSSRADWSAPQGNHSRCLHSGDLPCGACLDAVCRYGDVHCLTRYSAEQVVEAGEALLAGLDGVPKTIAAPAVIA